MGSAMGAVEINAWDLRHLLLSVEQGERGERDGEDLEGVVQRAMQALAGVPPPPPIAVAAPPSMLVEAYPLWIFETNAWLVAASPGGACLVVDVPPRPDRLIARIRELDLHLAAVVLSHGHVDHTGGVRALLQALRARVPVFIHPADRDLMLGPEAQTVMSRVSPDVARPPVHSLRPLEDGVVVTAGTISARAAHTPGHTPGSTCLLIEGAEHQLLVTGDVLFAGGTGRCDLPNGSRPQAEASLDSVVARLPDATVVLPGHGGVTTVGQELRRRAAAS
jgi:glyoxylase-like metal-dependent hydrolase (beta-lactamase superfamily II)